MSEALRVAPEASQELDIRNQRCPMTWVRVKLALEKMETGEVLAVRLQGGEARRNVPRAAEGEGHAIVSIEEEGEESRIWIRKGGERAA